MRCAISWDIALHSGLLDLVTNTNVISKETYQFKKYFSLRKEWRRCYTACVARKATIASPTFNETLETPQQKEMQTPWPHGSS